MQPFTVAAVQAAPIFLDRDATIRHVGELTAAAVAGGAAMVVFPEAFVPTYPEWVWRTVPWEAPATALFARLFDQAVDVPGPAVDALATIARSANAFLFIGVNERLGGTLYNSVLGFCNEGRLIHHHRKLVATGPERMIWGCGDGSRLTVAETPLAKVGSLICWENYMPLARAALYALGIEVYLAPTWDSADSWIATLRHIAKEGRVYVVGVCCFMEDGDVPKATPMHDELYGEPGRILSKGNSCIVAPNGEIIAGPLMGEAGILYADIDPAQVATGRMQFDSVGHYARPDVFHLTVDRRLRESGVVLPPPIDHQFADGVVLDTA